MLIYFGILLLAIGLCAVWTTYTEYLFISRKIIILRMIIAGICITAGFCVINSEQK